MLPVVLQFASGEVRKSWCKCMGTKPLCHTTLHFFCSFRNREVIFCVPLSVQPESYKQSKGNSIFRGRRIFESAKLSVKKEPINKPKPKPNKTPTNKPLWVLKCYYCWSPMFDVVLIKYVPSVQPELLPIQPAHLLYAAAAPQVFQPSHGFITQQVLPSSSPSLHHLGIL